MTVSFQSQNPFPRKILRFAGWLCVAFGSVPVLFLGLLMTPLGSHKRTKAKSRCSELTSTSASPPAIAVGSLPTHTAGTTDSATRSRSALRSRRASASGPIGICP